MSTLGRALWRELLDELEERIVDGTLAPGQRLVEQDVAAEFGVSRGPVREAFTELARIGLLEINARRGAGVRVFTEQDISEIYELRECLEVCALSQPNALDDAVLARIAEKMRLAEEARRCAKLSVAVAADMDFHRELCRLSTNRRLVDAWETQAAQVRVVVSTAHQTEYVLPVLAEHQMIFDALAAGQRDAAQTRLRNHLRHARDLLLSQERAGSGNGSG